MGRKLSCRLPWKRLRLAHATSRQYGRAEEVSPSLFLHKISIERLSFCWTLSKSRIPWVSMVGTSRWSDR
jgi:hypothetical protein